MEQKRGERRRNKDFKRGGKLGQGVGALKRGRGAGTPLQTMDYFRHVPPYGLGYLGPVFPNSVT